MEWRNKLYLSRFVNLGSADFHKGANLAFRSFFSDGDREQKDLFLINLDGAKYMVSVIYKTINLHLLLLLVRI